MFNKFKWVLIIFPLLTGSTAFAQHDGCDKCSMLKEEYEAAMSPKKEEIYAFFKSQCLDTETEFLTENNTVSDTIQAVKVRITSTGKCIDYKEVKEIDKKTKRETMSFKVTKKDTVYTMGTKTPSFPGGDEALVKFINKSLKYPIEARTGNITGTAFVQFVVSSTGEIRNIRLLRSPDKSTGEEAVRVIKSMPKWVPGEFKASKVSMVHSIPVRFTLK